MVSTAQTVQLGLATSLIGTSCIAARGDRALFDTVELDRRVLLIR